MIYHFLNSNLFQTVISFIIGLFVFATYKLQKANDKESITKIIMIDILDSERDISEYRVNELTNLSNIQQKTSWFNNRHLFVNDFLSEEFSYINDFFDFYNRFAREVSINESLTNATFIARSQKVQYFTMDIILEKMKIKEYDLNNIDDLERKHIHDIIMKAHELYFGDNNILTYQPAGPQTAISKILPLRKTIIGSTIRDKLTNISSKRFIKKFF